MIASRGEHAGGPRAPVTGAILAGGAASRFGGTAKGLLTIGAARLIDLAIAALRPAVDDLLIVANSSDADRWVPGTRIARDRFPVRATLVGIHAALSEADTDVAVVGWDMPFVPTALIRHLIDRRRPGVGAVVPEGPSGPEPCAGVYSRAALPTIEALVRRGEFTMSAALRALPRVTVVPLSDVVRVGATDAARMFANVNTPDDLAAILSRTADEP